MNLHLVQGSDLEYGSLQEGLAITAWRKQQRIDLYRKIAIVTATINPEKANKALQNLIEEMFPEVAKEREGAIENAMKIMEAEKERTYSVAPAGQSVKKGPWGRVKDILKNKRRPRRPS